MNKEKNGILDPLGEKPNPLTQEPYTDNYKKLAQVWSKFPAYEKAYEIIKQIRENQVVLIISGTGSGKTVLLPKYALHALNYEKKIAITLPKQIVTKSAAEFAAETLDVKLGQEVGYQFKGESKKSEKTKLFYATDGTIVSKLLKDPSLSEFDCVIIDEAHERKIQIDFLLYLLKETLKMRPEFKLIIMSATINEEIFKNYFNKFKYVANNIGGKTNYPIQSIFLKEPISEKDYLEKGYEILKQILTTEKEGDIIFFVTSSNEGRTICEKLNKENLDTFCVEVYSGMNPEQEELAKDAELYKEKLSKSRKVVLATPVAESSLTIDGLKYVIDSGYELYGYYDPELDARVLMKSLITHAQAKQRMGRAGRTAPGVCYHLYTEKQFNEEFKKFPEPNIRVSDITDESLRLLTKLKSVDKLLDTYTDFIEPPREKYFKSAMKKLTNLNLIKDGEITEFGMFIAEMPFDPVNSLTLYAARKLNCLKEMIMIICMIDASKANINEIFRKPELSKNIEEGFLKKLEDRFYEKKRKFKSDHGDFVPILRVMQKTFDVRKDEKKYQDFTYDNFLNRKVLDKAIKYFYQVKENVYRSLDSIQAIENINNAKLEDRINTAISFGYKLHYAQLVGDSYNTVLAKNININKDSFVNLMKSMPKRITYYELFNNNGRLELSLIATINDKVEELLSLI
jgi:pre-mRNA-splicing factor ATP-dependent RNA helicase DHX15/PRP43